MKLRFHGISWMGGSVIRWKPWDETGISWDFMDGMKLPPRGQLMDLARERFSDPMETMG